MKTLKIVWIFPFQIFFQNWNPKSTSRDTAQFYFYSAYNPGSTEQKFFSYEAAIFRTRSDSWTKIFEFWDYFFSLRTVKFSLIKEKYFFKNFKKAMLRKILYCSYSAFLLESYELKSVEILNLSIKMSEIWLLENEKLKKIIKNALLKFFFNILQNHWFLVYDPKIWILLQIQN